MEHKERARGLDLIISNHSGILVSASLGPLLTGHKTHLAVEKRECSAIHWHVQHRALNQRSSMRWPKIISSNLPWDGLPSSNAPVCPRANERPLYQRSNLGILTRPVKPKNGPKLIRTHLGLQTSRHPPPLHFSIVLSLCTPHSLFSPHPLHSLHLSPPN